MRFRRPPPSTASSTLRPLLFGDAAIDEWPPPGDTSGDPWSSFARARAAVADGKRDEARELWLTIARTRGLESRHALQAWTLLRRDGVLPDGAEATVVHAVVCEVPVAGGHDLLAVFGDGSVRYLNHSGAAVVHEPGTSAVTDEAAAAVHAAAEPLGEIVGLWDEPELPALPPGHARLLLLTPGGFRFGQGPSESLWHDPSAGPVLQAATHLLVLVTAP